MAIEPPNDSPEQQAESGRGLVEACPSHSHSAEEAEGGREEQKSFGKDGQPCQWPSA